MGYGFTVMAFRGDNTSFKSDESRMELKDNDKTITYCGVGAHHQNGIAERYILTMVENPELFYSIYMQDGMGWLA